ncbi:ankyrin repeat domain-containing protein 40 [Lates japonicus]|uniref:Ankyrin repeat domain-containing protein 40 n=1 Tax=Lates japonicus TaxID=270547 RepID=A0AAD3RHS5_LATJO|nr:ankyrin repeat domain-containing protein 40 [Lates japonicus]
MSTTSLDKELQERLREASAIGDIDEVRTLVESGVNVNSQNEINGWTCLHWACKRNHKHIVSYLLSCGADKEILTAKDELASQLTSKPEIKRLLGELVLKVRIQNPNARENDFIEVELDRQELTYRSLLRVCCRELDISAAHVEKIRKLPNTMLRKDKDVARLQDFQELEVVLEKAEGLSLFSGTGGLTDRPCYNMKASRLTY